MIHRDWTDIDHSVEALDEIVRGAELPGRHDATCRQIVFLASNLAAGDIARDKCGELSTAARMFYDSGRRSWPESEATYHHRRMLGHVSSIRTHVAMLKSAAPGDQSAGG